MLSSYLSSSRSQAFSSAPRFCKARRRSRCTNPGARRAAKRAQSTHDSLRRGRRREGCKIRGLLPARAAQVPVHPEWTARRVTGRTTPRHARGPAAAGSSRICFQQHALVSLSYRFLLVPVGSICVLLTAARHRQPPYGFTPDLLVSCKNAGTVAIRRQIMVCCYPSPTRCCCFACPACCGPRPSPRTATTMNSATCWAGGEEEGGRGFLLRKQQKKRPGVKCRQCSACCFSRTATAHRK